MKVSRPIIGLIVPTVFSFACTAYAAVGSVSRHNYIVPWSTIDEAGRICTATSYRLVNAVGQSVAGRTDNTEYSLQIGFLIGRPVVDIEDEDVEVIATTYSLHQNWPNPFRTKTSIRYTIPANRSTQPSRLPTRLSIYDLSGRLVRSLIDAYRLPGLHIVTWDGRDAGGYPVPAGTYFCRLDSGDYAATRKLVLLR